MRKFFLIFFFLIHAISVCAGAYGQTSFDEHNERVIRIPQHMVGKTLCGPICIAHAARWCGKDVSIEKAIKVTNWQFSNTSLLDLKQAAKELGIECRAIEFHPSKTIEFLSKNPHSIVIGVFKKEHFLVLSGLDKTTARLVDPMKKQANSVSVSSPELVFAQNTPVLVLSPGNNRSWLVIIFWIMLLSIVAFGVIITKHHKLKK